MVKNQGYFYGIMVEKKGKNQDIMVEIQGCFCIFWLQLKHQIGTSKNIAEKFDKGIDNIPENRYFADKSNRNEYDQNGGTITHERDKLILMFFGY